ncbi:MAG: hypothetical protein GKR99_16285 [Rhodobacteraceae bacterium]|nr:hypothetical protein [Paracoccaceae bacterium]
MTRPETPWYSAANRSLRAMAAFALTTLLLAAPQPISAQEQTDGDAADQEFTLVPAAQGEANGFRALAVITSDEDWLEKFQNAGADGPEFLLTPGIAIGKPARLLLFFAGAFPQDGKVNVLCYLRLYEDDEVVHEVDTTQCSNADDPGDITRLMLADTTLVVTPEEADAGKILRIEVEITDGFRSEVVPIEVSVFYGGAG